MDSVTFEKTQKDKQKLVDKIGNTYNFNNKNKLGTRQYWKCSNVLCPGRFIYVVHKKQGYISVSHLDGEYNPLENAKSKAKAKMKELTKASASVVPETIMSKVLQDVPLEVQALLPSEKAMKWSIRRWGSEGEKKKEPASRSAIDISGLVDLRDDPFLIFDSKDDDRILVFATTNNLKELSLCRTWLCDGTFKTSPLLYYQLYTIHGLDDKGWALPYVYALLPNKKRTTYEVLFREVERCSSAAGWPVSPDVFILDFESAAISAIVNIFPNATPQGCLFHFSNNLRRNMSSALKKHADCSENSKFSLFMRCFTALAFLPVQEVEIGYRELVNSYHGPDNLQNDFKTFADYFYSTYIGTSYTPPKFAMAFWNVKERVTDDLPRTNNLVEGWNNRFRNMASCEHPSFWRFIRLLQKEQDRVNRCLVRRLSHPCKPPVHKRIHENIKHLVSEYGQFSDRQDYIKGLAIYVQNARKIQQGKRKDLD